LRANWFHAHADAHSIADAVIAISYTVRYANGTLTNAVRAIGYTITYAYDNTSAASYSHSEASPNTTSASVASS
jgi:hypothetical protein